MRNVLEWLPRFVAGGLLLASASAHIFNGYKLFGSILEYRVLPDAAAVALAATLPYFQLVLGTAILFVPAYRRAAFGLAVLFFTAFLAAQISAPARGLDISCGCFGQDDAPIGWKSIGIAGLGWLASLAGAVRWSRGPKTSDATRAGFTLIETLVAIAIIAVLVGLLLAAVQRVRASAARLDCQNRLKQNALALHAYPGAHAVFPPGLSVQADGGKYPYLGWTGRILPFVEQDTVWRNIERAFATDPAPLVFYGHAPHAEILATPIRQFACPADSRVPGPGQNSSALAAYTSYLGVEGRDQFARDGILFLDSRIRIADVTDGTSQTLLLGERPPSSDLRLGWWYRGWGQKKEGSAEMLLGVREFNETRGECKPGVFTFRDGRFDNLCDAFHFCNRSPGKRLKFRDFIAQFHIFESNLSQICMFGTRNRLKNSGKTQ